MSKQILGAKLQNFKILHCVFLTLWFFSIGPGPTGTVRVAGRWWWCKSRNGGFDPPFFLQRYFIVQFETLHFSLCRHKLLFKRIGFYETFFFIHQLYNQQTSPKNQHLLTQLVCLPPRLYSTTVLVLRYLRWVQKGPVVKLRPRRFFEESPRC